MPAFAVLLGSRVALLVLLIVLLMATGPAAGAVTKTELAGNDLASYPFFEYVHAINAGSPLHVAIDPSRFPAIVNQTCDIYVVAAKKTAGWNLTSASTWRLTATS